MLLIEYGAKNVQNLQNYEKLDYNPFKIHFLSDFVMVDVTVVVMVNASHIVSV